MNDEKVLICNPDEPGFLHGASMSAQATAPWCRHRVMVSAAGVSLLMTTPGLVTCCLRCMPTNVDPEDFELMPEIAQQFKDETGEELTPERALVLQRMMVAWRKDGRY